MEAVAAESAVNATELELATGQVATFGGTYQFLNQSSSKFLQAKKTIADEDATALKCSMVEADERSKMPWFNLQPGFRTRNEGEPVRMGDTVVLASMKMPGMFVHAVMDRTKGDDRATAEINIYDKPTRFKIVPVAKSADLSLRNNEGAVCAGDYVELFQRQTQVYLHRSPEGEPMVFDTDGEEVDDTDDVRVVVVRADLLWQLNMPTMQWCGSAVTHSARNPTSFSLRDGISGGFLEQNSGLGFSGE